MTAPLVLVDTSAWVEFFNRPSGLHHAALADLLDADRAAITGVIAAELLRGCRAEEMDELEESLAGVLRIELGFADWLEVGRDLAALRRRGLTASLTDASVAHAAQRAKLSLFTLDADFQRFWPQLARFAPLERAE